MKAKRHFIALALRIAAEQFDDDAATCSGRRNAGNIEDATRVRLREQFETQARQARNLAEEVEESDAIALED